MMQHINTIYIPWKNINARLIFSINFDAKNSYGTRGMNIWKMTGYLYIYRVFYCYVFPVYLPLIPLSTTLQDNTRFRHRYKKVFPSYIHSTYCVKLIRKCFLEYLKSRDILQNEEQYASWQEDVFDGRKFYCTMLGYLRFIIHKSCIQQQLQ